MPRAREQIVDLSVTPYYHCISRCVRRALLCGRDPYTGESYEHRKAWIRDQLHELVDIFAIDVCAYAILSDRFHTVLRADVELAAGWSDDEVAERYTGLHPMALPAWEEKLGRKARAELAETWRDRLCDISWMMRVLRENIARKANREDKLRGRFWDGRFKSQPVLDDRGLIVCMAYVDLNPLRAGMTRSLAASEYTSFHERTRDQAAKRAKRRRQTAPHALAPMSDQAASRETTARLPLALDEYRALLEWTVSARGGRKPKGRTPPVLARAGIDPAAWLTAMEDDRVEAAASLGSPESLARQAQTRGHAWSRGVGLARELAAE